MIPQAAMMQSVPGLLDLETSQQFEKHNMECYLVSREAQLVWKNTIVTQVY
jgi:hypothetical protein